jgi:hypothetical protein
VFRGEEEWIKGAELYPYQIDEIEILSEDTGLLSQQGIQIYDKNYSTSRNKPSLSSNLT